MRNKVRVQHKVGTKSASLQTKTRRRAKAPSVRASSAVATENTDAFVPTDGACILFYQSNTDRTIASVAISADQLACLERQSADRGISLVEFVQQGFNRLLAGLEGRISPRANFAQAGNLPALAAAKGGVQ